MNIYLYLSRNKYKYKYLLDTPAELSESDVFNNLVIILLIF